MSHASTDIRFALKAFLATWLVVALCTGQLLGTQAVGVMTLTASAVVLLGLLGRYFTRAMGGPQASPIFGIVLRFVMRSTFAVGLLLVAFDYTPLVLSGETKLLIGFSTIPFYFALLAVEIFAARPILVGLAQGDSARPPAFSTHQSADTL